MNIRTLFVAVVLASSCTVDGSRPTISREVPASTIGNSDNPQQEEPLSEPPVPYVGGLHAEIPASRGPEEIDCVDAESLCEEGVFGCDELADYCDVGPDGLEELPDEYDWDGN